MKEKDKFGAFYNLPIPIKKNPNHENIETWLEKKKRNTIMFQILIIVGFIIVALEINFSNGRNYDTMFMAFTFAILFVLFFNMRKKYNVTDEFISDYIEYIKCKI